MPGLKRSRSHWIAIFVTFLLVAIGSWLPLVPNKPLDHRIAKPSLEERIVEDLKNFELSNTGDYPDQSFDLTRPPPSLGRRASDSPAYTSAETKGTAFRCYFDGTKHFQSTSWSSYDDLTSWGWQRSTRTADDTNRLLRQVSNVLQAKGIDTVAGKNQYVTWDQTEKTTHKGKLYLPTQGTYGNIYNPSQGLIIARKNYGPTYKAKQNKVPTSNIPDLQQSQLKDLRYVMRYQVQGDTTPAIVRRALEKCNKKSKVPVWPGYTFEPNAVRRGLLGGNKCKGAWEALMGTPHLTGVAWLLLQRRDTMGDKVISGITVFSTDQSTESLATDNVNILVEIKDRAAAGS